MEQIYFGRTSHVVKEPYCRIIQKQQFSLRFLKFFVLQVPVLHNICVGGREFDSEIIGAQNLSLETNLVQIIIEVFYSIRLPRKIKLIGLIYVKVWECGMLSRTSKCSFAEQMCPGKHPSQFLFCPLGSRGYI